MATTEPIPDVDVFEQSFSLLLRDGTPVDIPLAVLRDFIEYSAKSCINYGSQIGATCIMVIALLALTKPDKRASPIFGLNLAALLLNLARTVLYAAYHTSPWSDPYAFLAGDYSRVPRAAYAQSIAPLLLTLLVLALLEASLVLQVRVVCVTAPRAARRALAAASGAVALAAVGVRFALTVANARAILAAADFYPWRGLVAATYVTTTISVCFFSAVFSVKLWAAIRQRRALGMQRLEPMRIIFVMGCQSMIVPAILSVFQYIGDAPDLGTVVLTSVTISLPLSALWAATAVENGTRGTGSSSSRPPILGTDDRYGSMDTGSSECKDT